MRWPEVTPWNGQNEVKILAYANNTELIIFIATGWAISSTVKFEAALNLSSLKPARAAVKFYRKKVKFGRD